MEFILDNFNTVVVLAFIVYIFISAKMYVKRRQNRASFLPNSSVLFSYYSEGTSLHKLIDGTLNNELTYRAFTAENKQKVMGNPDLAVIYIVQLPFASKIHLLGIPKNTNAIMLNPAQKNGTMEKVSLEGNYDQVFQLYAGKGMQSESRYVLDPEAMEFTIDFCQSQNWEIVGNELYFVVTGAMKNAPNDETGILEDAVLFIEEIRPKIERPLNSEELRKITPYGQNHRKDVQCPLCRAHMHDKKTYYECPEGHGVLVSGGMLGKLVNGEERLNLTRSNYLKHDGELICPSCQNPMTRTQYAHKKMQIDSCTNCAYRWLDAGELIS
jgi:Zn-finger nucleic acid-binding protein